MQCALATECRFVSGVPREKKRKKRARCTIDALWEKYGTIPQGAYVLLSGTEQPRECDRVTTFKPLFAGASYDEQAVLCAQGKIDCLKLVFQPHASPRVAWLRFRNRKTQGVFVCMPVLVRPGQRYGVAFIDTLPIPGIRIQGLREATVACIQKARGLFNVKHARQFLHRPHVLTMEVAVVIDTGGDANFASPPPDSQFVRMGGICVRAMRIYEAEAYLHKYVRGRRCYHVCTPRGISDDEQQSLEAECARQCAGGVARWLGMCPVE